MSKCCDCNIEVPGQWICNKCAENYKSLGGGLAVLNRLFGVISGDEDYKEYLKIGEKTNENPNQSKT